MTVRVPQQPRAIRTRAKLLAAAQREFSERGHGGATARSIAQRAGVATGSFYQYFRDKDAALRELGAARLAQISREVLGHLEPQGADGSSERGQVRGRLRALVETLMAYHREDRGLHAVLTERRAHDPELDRLTTEGERALVGALAATLARWGHSGDHEATAFVLFGMVEAAVHAHCLGHPLVSDERLIDALLDALVHVALPRPFDEAQGEA